mgnify:CR=1 FL=1
MLLLFARMRTVKRFAAYGTYKLDNTSLKALPVNVYNALVNIVNFVSREEPVSDAKTDNNEENYCPCEAT